MSTAEPSIVGWTIREVARLGVWVIEDVDDLGLGNRDMCDRCLESIRYVYHLRNTQTDELVSVGSTCGPLVCQVSEEEWAAKADVFSDVLQLQETFAALEKHNQTIGGWLHPWWRPYTALINSGTITKRDIRAAFRELRQLERKRIDAPLKFREKFDLLCELLPRNSFLSNCAERMTANRRVAVESMLSAYSKMIHERAYEKGVRIPRSVLTGATQN